MRTFKYNLLANICHEGNAKMGFYKVHVRNKAKNTWYYGINSLIGTKYKIYIKYLSCPNS